MAHPEQAYGPLAEAAHRIAAVRRSFRPQHERQSARAAAEREAISLRAAAQTPRWCRVPAPRADSNKPRA